ncbi:hypothetical protein [Candidatus Sororendozoicomonas aggregata]|uniref:hypothetical protein n=1 Tax=Candidatus Sororendozoicomonas aggregata TaxID=3073239 RepID=UPI002ED40BE9
MRMNFTLHAIKSMTKKSFVFFTLVLSLSIIDNAYSRNTYLYIGNKIPPGDVSYSKKGYTVVADGKGACMGKKRPAPHTVTYEENAFSRISIDYSVSHWCAFKDSTQNFKVINNDTGKVDGRFAWRKPLGGTPYIKMINNLNRFMVDVTLIQDQPNALNLCCLHHKS